MGLDCPHISQKQLTNKFMKTNLTISEITHEDLVNLFSTSLYGSTYLEADYTNPNLKKAGDCFEDILAKNLLAGDCIVITDWYAEGEAYGNLFHIVDDEDECVHYTVGLEDIKRGLERAANGTFTITTKLGEDYIKGEKESARRSFNSFADDDAVDFDLIRADILMQIILFDEIIYG